MKENAGLPAVCAVIGLAEYAQLRDQVALLRGEVHAARAGSGTQRKLEALQRRQEDEARSLREAECQAELAKAQAALRDQLDKAARARKLAEREKKALQARADELAGQLEALHRAQERALQEAQQDAARRQSELEAQHSQAAAEASLAEAALQQRHAEELTAARAEAAQGLEAAAATVAAWQQRCQQAEATRGQTAGALRSALAEAEELRAAVQDLRRQVAEVGAGAQRRDSESQGLGRRIVQLEAELEARGAAHAAELRRLRERHAAELSAIQGRLAQVVGCKDGVIAELRQQLAAASLQLRQMDDLLAG